MSILFAIIKLKGRTQEAKLSFEMLLCMQESSEAYAVQLKDSYALWEQVVVLDLASRTPVVHASSQAQPARSGQPLLASKLPGNVNRPDTH